MVAYDAIEPTPIRVLLIDGNEGDRQFLARAIESCAAVQLRAFDGVAGALTQLGEDEPLPHVIFADLGLRDIPAWEMMHWMRCRGEFASVWLVAVTADLKLATLPSRHYGADALLVKPISMVDLAAVLALSANARTRTRTVPPA